LEVFLSEVDEGAGNVGVVGDKPTVEVGKAEEGAYIFDFGGSWPFGNSVKLAWFDDHSEVFYLVCGEFTFLEFEMQVKFGHTLENTFGAFFMCLSIRGENKEVVHVDDEPSFGDHVSEGVIHEPLESGRELVRPKNMMVGSKRPLWVMKVAFHWCPSLIWTLL